MVECSGTLWESVRLPLLTDILWQARWTVTTWREYLAASEAESELTAIRRCTHTGRPLGDAEFVSALEKITGRRLAPQKKGRQMEEALDPRQASLPLNTPEGKLNNGRHMVIHDDGKTAAS